MSSLAGAEDIHPQSHQPLTLGGETSSEQPSGHKEAAARCVRVSPSCTWERGQRRADRHQGQGLEQSCWGSWHTGPCCSGHQKLPAQAEGTHKETHPALQLERRRRRRKCTWCFEFRKLQMSISQGIALTHLLSAKGQKDIVHEHQHPVQGHRPSEPASCLLSTLTTTEPEPRLQQSSCTHPWSTWQGSITASVLTACATQGSGEISTRHCLAG